MATTVQPARTAATSGGVQVPTVRPAEQSIRTNFLVLVMNDLDTGQPTLCSATDPHESVDEVDAARVMEQAAEAHKKIDEGVQLALAFEGQQRRARSIKNEDGALNEVGRQLLAEIADRLTDLFAGAEDPLAALREWHAGMQKYANAPQDEHYPWCQAGACLTLCGDDGVYIEHQGPRVALPAPDGVDSVRGNLVDARLAASTEDGTPATVVSLTGADGNGTIVQGKDLDKLISDTALFLHQLRLMRTQVTEVQS
ncbi:hypothetical protein EDD90_7358 [Streptomyces sp. Ag109_O5-1]|uniref:hypothetical protein n=1 Tax=Streptomyces sp. Ag109_O5-1 TaxID=1938851 RepID=UPI000F4F7BE0|nr:hypothetical protein [Streptomyces sp. Ag109_O5-1]RPE44128.1 hypothetical protein EDD90_7358 [Streptomyces sp. Ag109_O5-1]